MQSSTLRPAASEKWHTLMSALGQKQTFASQKAMSALPPKADMSSATRYVRFVPIADILINSLSDQTRHQASGHHAYV